MPRITSIRRTSRPPSTGSPPRSDGRAPRLPVDESDERLVELARAGDERAFAAIVERYRVPLLRYCQGILPTAAADDALQQTFINAYSALTSETASAPVALRPWLYRVAHNAALNVARDPHSGHDELPEGLDGVERPEDVVQRQERFKRVVGAVRALPDKQRQVIVRHALDGDSHERIAADLGLSDGAIRQLMHRARRTVREAAAALLPPIARFLPWGAETAPVAKVAAVAVVVAGAGGSAMEIARHDAPERRPAVVAKAPERTEARAAPVRRANSPVPAQPLAQGDRAARSTPRGSTNPGSGTHAYVHREDSSGSGGDASSGRSDSSGPGSGGDDSSGSGSPGSDDSSGSGSSGSDDSSGRGTSGSGSSGNGPSGSGSSGSGSSGTSGSGSSGSGSSGSGSSGSGSSGSGSSGSSGSGATPTPTPTIDSSGSGSGSGSSGSGGGDDDSSGPG